MLDDKIKGGFPIEFKYYKRSLPKVGDTVKLMIDPQGPVTIRDPQRAGRARNFYAFCGAALLLIGFGLMVVFMVTGIGIFEH